MTLFWVVLGAVALIFAIGWLDYRRICRAAEKARGDTTLRARERGRL